ncbi:MAG: tetratricopeptide repeat protein, partial [Alphaproteobacteria bacterium]|nr:tetratricopeptide repeat protein [Alphaproteobacteria bacterium]
AVYDAHIWAGGDQIVFNLLDASALLWRLWSGGIDVGGRWEALTKAWGPHLGGTGYGFNDWHAAMALLGSGAAARVDAMIATLKNADPDTEAGRWQAAITLPLIEGFRAFAEGRHEAAADILFDVRRIAHRFGGSHAQRDVIDWTLTEAALRGGLSGMARALTDERLALRPHSPVNRAFLARAEALEAAGRD